jgi:CheY-like chemotaxis protein
MQSASFAHSLPALEEIRCAARNGIPYHFMIADYRMPELDGARLASAVKADPATRNTIVVMLTSISGWRGCRDVEDSAVDACLIKPVRHGQLLHVLLSALAKQQTQSLASLSTATDGGAPKIAEQGRARVLVADDNVVNQRVVVRMLESTGVRADVAATGREAIEMLRMIHYDLVLMDCQMPVMTGHQAVTEIRQKEGSGRRIPVVSMTAADQDGCQQHCLDCGMDDILHKPVRIQALAEVVQRWVPKASQMAAAEYGDQAAS